MAVLFSTVGSIAVNSADAFVDVVAPTCAVDDILICVLLGKDNLTHSAPDVTWTAIGTQTNNTTGMTSSHWWKRAVAGSSGATFRFTKSADNNVFFAGVISAWTGAIRTGSPIDTGTPTVNSTAVASDTVSYTDFDPVSTNLTVIASGIYNDDLTTAGTISGTNPTLDNRYDLETGTGTDCSFFAYSGLSDGTATGNRSNTTTSMTDAINQGWLFGILPAVAETGLLPFCISPQPTR